FHLSILLPRLTASPQGEAFLPSPVFKKLKITNHLLSSLSQLLSWRFKVPYQGTTEQLLSKKIIAYFSHLCQLFAQ
ncbi:MAG: hypothetical protein IJS41_10310, partial [Clostridia bacterium]|nr:hypothetical protein [Clostridia bacterium]